MPERAKWDWKAFAKSVGEGLVVGAATEVGSGGSLNGFALLGGAAGGAALYAYNWLWGRTIGD